LITVGESCFGSPTNITLLQPKVKGIRLDISVDWPASSIITWSNLQLLIKYLLPAPDNVAKTIWH
jgi:hypothetical protein